MPFSKIFLLAVVFKVLLLAVVLGNLCHVFWQHHLLSHSGARDFEKERKYIDLFFCWHFWSCTCHILSVLSISVLYLKTLRATCPLREAALILRRWHQQAFGLIRSQQREQTYIWLRSLFSTFWNILSVEIQYLRQIRYLGPIVHFGILYNLAKMKWYQCIQEISLLYKCRNCSSLLNLI